MFLTPFVFLHFLAMDPAAIEEAVRVKEPLSSGTVSGKLFGEDALLDWPGAAGPLLQDRDEFMAKAAANVATGKCELEEDVEHMAQAILQFKLSRLYCSLSCQWEIPQSTVHPGA